MYLPVPEIVDDGTVVEVHRNEPRAGNRNLRVEDGIECPNDFVDRQVTEARIRRLWVMTRQRAGREWIVDDESILNQDDRQTGRSAKPADQRKDGPDHGLQRGTGSRTPGA